MDAHILLRLFAALLGRVMPFWMPASPIQICAVLFTLVAPVPINNRIARWTPQSLPNDWRPQEHRWDVYHWVRTGALLVAFALLTLSMSAR